MALPTQLNDRQHQSYRDTGTPGQTKVGIEIENTAPINVTGSLTVTQSLRQQYLNADDTKEVPSYDDIGTKNERITLMTYTAPSVGAQTVYKTFTYTLISGRYILTEVQWSIV